MRRQGRTLVPELFDWLESGLPRIPGWSVIPGVQTIRVEDYREDGRYVLRAELPGVDPNKDIEMTVGEGVLTIRSERTEEEKDRSHCEFRYGSSVRSFTLPRGAKEDEITAAYRAGILTVTIPVAEDKEAARRIEVSHDD